MTLEPPSNSGSAHNAAAEFDANASVSAEGPVDPDPSNLALAPAVAATPDHRLIGPDVVRAVALIGVVIMNFHGYLILRGGERSDNFWGNAFDPWEGPLATRFAALFVFTAGVGVTLFTRRSLGDKTAVSAKRWTLVRRGLLLYAFGLLFNFIWEGTILVYYGGMFLIGAFLFTLPSLAIAAVGVTAWLAGAGINWWVLEAKADGKSTTWLTSPSGSSPRGLVLDLFVNGTHPLFPWLAFFCAGLVVARALRHDWWRVLTFAVGAAMFGAAVLLSDAFSGAGSTALAKQLASDQPWDRGVFYTASALGTALMAFSLVYTIAMWFPRSFPIRLLADAGQMTLTLYIAHALVFNAMVDWWGWIEPSGLDLALTFAAIYWVIAIAAAAVWHRIFRIGPAEWVYRKLSS